MGKKCNLYVAIYFQSLFKLKLLMNLDGKALRKLCLRPALKTESYVTLMII